MATNSKVGRTYYTPVNNTLTVQQVRLTATDINSWKTAIDSARNVINPRRKLLYELYDSIILDGHLLSVMNKRRTQITNKKVHFALKNNEGKIDDVVKNAVLETPWFYDMIKYILEAKAWGHSLIELVPEQGVINKAILVPRFNVLPEKGILAFDAKNPLVGLDYRLDPAYSNNLIEAGGEKDYGLLMSAAQYIIYKRGGFGDWAQFAELFGMPFREGNYMPYDEDGRKKLEDALGKMGGAGWVVTPEGTSIKFHDNNGAGKSEVFKDLIDLCDAQVSKIFLGNTMTTDNGSSRSQSETHQDTEDGIIQSDIVELEYLLNWNIKQKLIALGLPIPEGRFFYPEMQILGLEQRIDIDMKLAEKVPISEEYWYETYGIPKPDGTAEPIKVPGTKKEEEAPAVEPTKAAQKNIKAAMKVHTEHTEAVQLLTQSLLEINATYKPHDCANHS